MVESEGIFYRVHEENQTTSVAACAPSGWLARNNVFAHGTICPVIRIKPSAFTQRFCSRILCVPANAEILSSSSFHLCDHVSFIAFEHLSRLHRSKRGVSLTLSISLTL
jgi:hypothetical protein